jgi:G3E family GTPase
VLNNLPKNIFRVKGIVRFNNQSAKVVNGVFKRYDYTELPDQVKADRTQLILIGYLIKQHEAELLQQLAQTTVK